jgi:hypothetical protein
MPNNPADQQRLLRDREKDSCARQSEDDCGRRERDQVQVRG